MYPPGDDFSEMFRVAVQGVVGSEDLEPLTTPGRGFGDLPRSGAVPPPMSLPLDDPALFEKLVDVDVDGVEGPLRDSETVNLSSENTAFLHENTASADEQLDKTTEGVPESGLTSASEPLHASEEHTSADPEDVLIVMDDSVAPVEVKKSNAEEFTTGGELTEVSLITRSLPASHFGLRPGAATSR